MMGRPRKHSEGSGVNANGWMISYADMVTILLAMFIVLSTLSKDQTGMSLYYGTGSYRNAVKRFGLPGVSPNSGKTVQLNVPGPRFAVENASDEEGPHGPGRIIDAEEEIFQQYLAQLKKDFTVKNLGKEAGRSAVDFHSRLNTTAPLLSRKQRDMVVPLVLMAQQKGYQVDIIVWAPTPADTACLRSLGVASELRDELLADLGQIGIASERITPVAQPWRFKDIRRPVFSIVVTRFEKKDEE
jgi:Membrane MotB of proton-channel complex MotA/MotB